MCIKDDEKLSDKIIFDAFDVDVLEDRLKSILDLILDSNTDGSHHKQWILDQVVRIACGTEENYNMIIKAYCSGEDGPETYSWSKGIAP